MEPINAEECTVHVLVCTNERPPGKACCKKVGGQEFYQKLKMRVKDSGLAATHWMTRSGCLGYCNDVGTTVAIYRKNQAPEWFTAVTDADFEPLWDRISRP